ncbi:hypothetical protein [Allofournierella massiliensis]|uniref:hypothetical protein n=1 Tax=Allofournierella massiliensis TaxID=1650663 RepID=UPI0035682ACF
MSHKPRHTHCLLCIPKNPAFCRVGAAGGEPAAFGRGKAGGPARPYTFIVSHLPGPGAGLPILFTIFAFSVSFPFFYKKAHTAQIFVQEKGVFR